MEHIKETHTHTHTKKNKKQKNNNNNNTKQILTVLLCSSLVVTSHCWSSALRSRSPHTLDYTSKGKAVGGGKTDWISNLSQTRIERSKLETDSLLSGDVSGSNSRLKSQFYVRSWPHVRLPPSHPLDRPEMTLCLFYQVNTALQPTDDSRCPF